MNRQSGNNQLDDNQQSFPPITSGSSLLIEEPDMTIGESVKLKGNLRFENLLRIDGHVQGHLNAPEDAGLIVGVNGSVTGHILNISTVLIEGKVVGNIKVESLTLRSTAIVHGDVTCKSLESSPAATIVGQLHVSPFLDPPYIDKYGNLSPKNTAADEEDDYDFGPDLAAKNNNKQGLAGASKQSSGSKDAPPPQRITLLIIDPQVDFTAGGACAVHGADEDFEAIADFITQNVDKIDEIFVTLDTHHRMHLCHAIFWTNSNTGASPPPGTVITAEDLQNGVWEPRDNMLYDHCLHYINNVSKNPREDLRQLIIKPEHGLIGTIGHSIAPKLHAALQEWTGLRLRKIGYVMKGTNCLTDMNSAFTADLPIETDPSTNLDTNLIGRFQLSDRLVICGASNSSALNFSVRDILENWSANTSKILLVRDSFSSSTDDDKDREKMLSTKFWDYIKLSGTKVCRSPEVFL